LIPFPDKLAAWLKTEAGKSRKQRRTLKQLHAELVTLGFTGWYNRVAAFARKWRADRLREQQTTGRGVFVPLSFRPGKAFQFDWSEDYAVIGGVPGRGIYDNMKTAVDRVGRGKERQVNMRFLAITNHYVFAPEFCNPAAGWE